jgi:hypothetical protein
LLRIRETLGGNFVACLVITMKLNHGRESWHQIVMPGCDDDAGVVYNNGSKLEPIYVDVVLAVLVKCAFDLIWKIFVHVLPAHAPVVLQVGRVPPMPHNVQASW